MAHSSIIRKPIQGFVPREMEADEKEFYDKIYANIDKDKDSNKEKKVKKTVKKSEDKSCYTTPKFVIKHRSHVDIQECVDDKTSGLLRTIPRELIVEINLPLLKSSSDMTLDVTEKTVQVTSEKPSKYKLNLTLPYRVNQDNGSAKFDKDLKKLIITLPVKRVMCELLRDDSGVDSDQGSPTTPLSEEDSSEKECYSARTNFDNTTYELPEFTCHLFNKILAFTLNVKNVSESSIHKTITESSLHLTFSSISSSFFETNYAFYVEIPSSILDSVFVETWDNNIVVQIPVTCDIEYYFYGLNSQDLKKKFLEEPCILNTVLQNPIPEEPEPPVEKTPAISIATSSYESSGDELSCSYSPSKNRGILKRLANRTVGRSISESSLDDIVCSSLDSTIPEDGEMSTSLKKSVRFNDVIRRQLYRYCLCNYSKY